MSAFEALVHAYLRPPSRDERSIVSASTNVVLPTASAPDAAMRSICEADMLQRAAPPSIGLDSLRRRSIAPPAALRIVEDPFMADTVEDWSEVRSPSRAARRRRQGHRQRIRYVSRPQTEIYHAGDMLVMHPETARTLRAQISARGDALAREVEREMLAIEKDWLIRPR